MGLELYDSLVSLPLYGKLLNTYKYNGISLLENFSSKEVVEARLQSLKWAYEQAEALAPPGTVYSVETGTCKGYFAFLLSYITKRKWELFTVDINPQAELAVNVLKEARIPVVNATGDSTKFLPAWLSFSVNSEKQLAFGWVDGGHATHETYSDIHTLMTAPKPPYWIAVDDAITPEIMNAVKAITEMKLSYQLVHGPYEKLDHCKMIFFKRINE